MKLLKILLFLAFTGIFNAACSKEDLNSPKPPDKTDTSTFAKGADVSWVTEMESKGVLFYNKEGVATECMALMKSLGMNSIRLRVWVNPADGWNNKTDMLVKAKRAKDLGMRILIDFHYSDNWADPGKQTKPAAWTNLPFNDLRSAVSNHTSEILIALKNWNITPEWVQVGNETGNGMLWEDGKASVSMANYASLNNAGYEAVKAVFPNAKVMVHLHNGWDNRLFRWLFDGLKDNNGKWDVIGMSLYPKTDNWKELNDQCMANVQDMIQRYGKEVMISEVGMPWNEADTARLFLTDLITRARVVANDKCLGVFYWEPQAYNGWKGYTLGAFDQSGKPTQALDAFKE
jgi:arabinogalactan endo-1,4-beta-galactosidase